MMAEGTPVVYIFHGEHEHAIARTIAGLQSRLGDPSTAEMNTTWVNGRSPSFMGPLENATRAMPFLSDRRLVVLTDPLGSMKSPTERDKFIALLKNIPETTRLVIVVPRPLVDPRSRRKGKLHWLEKWAQEKEQQGKVYLREFHLPKGSEMTDWIHTQAQEAGGSFSPQAAAMLASLVGDDTRAAEQEIEKLLAYVNFDRVVEAEDVEKLTAYVAEASIFEMVDALGNQDGHKALRLLNQLLENDDPLRIFGMVARQFRLLFLTKELAGAGQRKDLIARQLGVPGFVAEKMMNQSRHFSQATLARIYHRLLEVDEAIKTGKIDGELALHTLVASLTAPK
jgi:DNA polymerase-3 subunit delta